MPTLEIIEVQQPPDSWTLKNGPAAGQEMHTYTLRAKGPEGEQTYQMNRKPTSGPPEIGPGDYEITPPKPGTSFPPKIKKAYSGGGGGRSPRDSRRIERQHAQKCAVEMVRMLGYEDEAPILQQRLSAWADWFCEDIDKAGTGAGEGAPRGSSVGQRPQGQEHPGDNREAAGSSPAPGASRPEPPSTAQKRLITTLLNKAGVSKDFQRTIVLSFADPLTKAAASRILDVLNDEALGHPESRVDALLREAGLERPSDLPPPDERDLEPAAVGAADSDIPF